MPFDGFFTHAMVHELNQTLQGGRVSKVNQPYPAEMVMVIRANRHNYSLLISANPSYPRIQITQIPYQNPAVPSNFAMTMRKYLEGALVKEVAQIENDRIVKLTFSTLDELGDPLELVMMVEIMARHSNVTLVNAKTGKIIDAIKHVGSDVNRVRLLLPGAAFIMPPKQPRFNPYLPNQIYSDLVRELKDDPIQLAKKLQASYQGLAPETASELAAELLASDSLPSAYQTFLRHFEAPQPVLITNEKNKTSFAAFTPINTVDLKVQSFATLSELLDAYYVNKAQSDRTKELAGQVLKVVHNELKKDQRKMKKFQKELADAADADRYRIRGELLTTWLHQVPRGAQSVELPNFYDENRPLKITLQPDLSPSRNAQKYFTRYNKLKASVKYVNEQMAITQKEIDYFETILSQIDLANPSDVQEIRLELQQQGYIKAKHKKGKKQRKIPVSKPEVFHAADGTVILVGKNNLQNDRLSFKTANKNEIWLHVKDMPGSHVVIRDSNPSKETILQAAQLAAWFSKGRDSAHVSVDYLPVKNLHKPSGAKPGFVTFRGQKTLSVTPKKLPN